MTDWRTEVYDQPCARSGKIGFMRDVDIDPDGQRAYVVSAGHFYYPACDTMNAFPMAPALAQTFSRCGRTRSATRWKRLRLTGTRST